MKIKDYRIVRGVDIIDLEERVKVFLGEEYHLVGGICTSGSNYDEDLMFYQAVALYENPIRQVIMNPSSSGVE